MFPAFQLRGCGLALPLRWHWMQTSPSGWQAWQDSVSVQARKEYLVASALDSEEKELLNGLLRRLMRQFEADKP